MGGTGSGISAEAPPEITQINRSRGPASRSDIGDAARAFQAALIGNRMAGFC